MDSSELFSHRQAPQVTHTDDRSSEPVSAPVFSDQPRKQSSDSSGA